MTPWFMIAIVSAIDIASSWSWVTYTVVAFRRSCRPRSSWHITSRNSESSAPIGSSIMKASGWRTIARPSATRWRSPLDRPDTGLSIRCSMRSTRAASATLASISRRGTPCESSGKAMLRRTFMCGYSANSWNTNAMSRCDARLKVTSSSPRWMVPEVGNSNPAIMRSVVVLPHPDGPSRQKNSPLRTVNVESFTATKSANALCRFWTRISAMAG